MRFSDVPRMAIGPLRHQNEQNAVQTIDSLFSVDCVVVILPVLEGRLFRPGVLVSHSLVWINGYLDRLMDPRTARYTDGLTDERNDRRRNLL